jgi:serine/threonine-protein kinase
MGEVFEAVHRTIERQVAIKILRSAHAGNPSINQRFLNEARAVNLIKHPGLVQISDFGQLADGSPYIVMEYLHGETLRQRLRRLQLRLPLEQVLHTLWQVASALVATHDAGIVHRDLKPENIMLVQDPIAPNRERAKLLDFGIARFDAGLHDQPSLTGGGVMGTPTYMSPEQCRGVGPIGSQSDVYSLGVMLFQLLAGRPPFVSDGVGELLNMHMSQEPPDLLALAPQTPAELAALVRQSLDKDPEQRPTMRQVVAVIEQLQAQQNASGKPRAGNVSTPLAPSLGLVGGALSDSLAGMLGREIEEEEEEAAGSDPCATTELLRDRPPAPPQARPPSGTMNVIVAAEATQRASQKEPAVALQTIPSGRRPPSDFDEGRQPSGRRRGRARWILALAAALTGGGGVLLAMGLPPTYLRGVSEERRAPQRTVQREVAESSPPTPPGATAPATVSWSISTQPSGARVVRADTNDLLGLTPWHAEPPRQEGTLTVRLLRSGYAEKEIRLDYQQSCQQQQALTPLPQSRRPSPEAQRTPRAQKLAPPPTSPLHEKAPDAPTRPVFEVID